MNVTFRLNGVRVEREADGAKRLLDFIREDLGLTGTKEGCGVGECGACTVILNGQAVHSCLSVVGQLQGGELWTVEGLEQNGELDALQQAFMNQGAVQCGFCTSGMLMSLKALLMHNPDPSDEEIRRAIAGNVCRCTGYREIKAAVREAVERRKHDEGI